MGKFDPALPTTEELRSLVFDYLRKIRANNRGEQLQFSKLFHAVERDGSLQVADRNDKRWVEQTQQKLKQVVWDLILERVMIPGTEKDEGNSGWPFLTVTEHGWNAIESSGPTPYDPDGYLRRIQQASMVHPTALRYLEEAIGTFKTGNYLASAVMLGAASERIVADVAESIPLAIKDNAKRDKFSKRCVRGLAGSRVRVVAEWCKQHKKQLGGRWTDDKAANDLERIADFIRERRNETGHPEDPPAVPSHEGMYSWLTLFPSYCKSLYELKAFLERNPRSIA